MVIGINCGHTVSGQAGCGAVGYIDESVETRAVGKRLEQIFKSNGHTVIDCTNDYASSTSENLNTIVNMANKQSLDLFVSIHFNAGGGKGTEVYTMNGTQHKEAVNVCTALNKLGFTNRGVKDGSKLAVVRRTNAKAMLIEVCFVDTKSDVELYKSLGADKVAQAIYSAITGSTPVIVSTQTTTPTVKTPTLEDRILALEKKVGGMGEVYDYVDDNMPSYHREAADWAKNEKIVVGDGNGRLGLTPMKLWFLTVLYRVLKKYGKI